MVELRPSRAERGLQPPVSSRPRIVVAETEEVVAAIMSDLLQDLGYDVCAIAGTMNGLVQAAHEHSPDIVVVDSMLAGSQDDRALVGIVSRLGMPHLFTTGGAFSETEVASLAKPFSQAELNHAIRCVLDRKPVSAA